MLQHKTKSQQQIQDLFNDSFTENKPIPFPQGEQSYAYSNIFYWKLIKLQSFRFMDIKALRL